MSQELTLVNQTPLASIGHVANSYAAQNVFSDYHSRIAQNTLRRLFASYLAQVGLVVTVDDLMNVPDTWQDMSYGVVQGFVKWMLKEGYAIDSINVRLATIKAYCKLVFCPS